jgi:hypothetical protein
MLYDSETRGYKLSIDYGVWGVFVIEECSKSSPENEALLTL